MDTALAHDNAMASVRSVAVFAPAAKVMKVTPNWAMAGPDGWPDSCWTVERLHRYRRHHVDCRRGGDRLAASYNAVLIDSKLHQRNL